MGRSPGERGSQKTCLAGKIVPPCGSQTRRPTLKGPSKLGATLQMTISSEGFFIFNTLLRRNGSYEKNLYRTDQRRLFCFHPF
jgi:hypothetical protein